MAEKGIRLLKLIQMNLWQGHLLNSAVRFLREENPDIVCLQEVPSCSLNIDFLSANSLEVILKELEMPHHYLSPRFSYRFMDKHGLYGNCILSRHPFIEKETIFTNGSFIEDINLNDSNHAMVNAQRVMIKIGSHNINIYNHHGYRAGPNPTGDEITRQNLQKVADLIKENGGSAVLAGDLNVNKESPNFEPIAQLGLRNLAAEHKIKSTLSKIHPAPNRDEVACDFILSSTGMGIKSFKVSDELVSDHKALIAQFEF